MMLTSRGSGLSEFLCSEEIEKLSDILDSFPSEDAMPLEMLDGFFTALHCCPTLVLPNSYLHMIYGCESEDESPFDDDDQFYFFFELLIRYWNGVGNCLQNEMCEPFLEDVQNAGSCWSIGFLNGVLLAEGSFESMMRDNDESMAFMPFFLLAFGNNKLYDDLPLLFEEEVTPEMRMELLDGLSVSAMFLYSRFHGSECCDEVGQNDSCSSGSVKKYKKCCLNKTIH